MIRSLTETRNVILLSGHVTELFPQRVRVMAGWIGKAGVMTALP